MTERVKGCWGKGEEKGEQTLRASFFRVAEARVRATRGQGK